MQKNKSKLFTLALTYATPKREEERQTLTRNTIAILSFRLSLFLSLSLCLPFAFSFSSLFLCSPELSSYYFLFFLSFALSLSVHFSSCCGIFLSLIGSAIRVDGVTESISQSIQLTLAVPQIVCCLLPFSFDTNTGVHGTHCVFLFCFCGCLLVDYIIPSSARRMNSSPIIVSCGRLFVIVMQNFLLGLNSSLHTTEQRGVLFSFNLII